MKKLFATLLLISTLVFCLHNKISITPFGVSFNLVPTAGLKLLIVALIVTFIYWTLEEIKTNKIIGTSIRLFRSKIRYYIEKKHGSKINNLKIKYPEISIYKNIYYVNKTLILKTSNITNNGNYQPDGFVLNIGRIQLYWLFFINFLKTIFSLKIFPYVGLLLWSIFILLSLLSQFAYMCYEYIVKIL